MEEKTDVKQGNLTRYDKKTAWNNTILNPDWDTHHNPAMQAVERLFDFRERKLRANVNEQMLQDAVDAVEHMDASDPDYYDLHVIVLGMAEQEYRALEHQHEKPRNSQGNSSAETLTGIDSISLEEINKRLTNDCFEKDTLEDFGEPDFDSRNDQAGCALVQAIFHSFLLNGRTSFSLFLDTFLLFFLCFRHNCYLYRYAILFY